MRIYNVYKTNNWHEVSSREFCGAFGSLQAAIEKICIAMREDIGDDEFDYIREDVVFELNNYHQTLCTQATDYEYDIYTEILNNWVA